MNRAIYTKDQARDHHRHHRQRNIQEVKMIHCRLNEPGSYLEKTNRSPSVSEAYFLRQK